MLVEPESRHRWPWCRRQYAVDVEGGNDYGMLLAHGHGLWDKGVEVWQVSAGGPLDDIVCVGDGAALQYMKDISLKDKNTLPSTVTISYEECQVYEHNETDYEHIVDHADKTIYLYGKINVLLMRTIITRTLHFHRTCTSRRQRANHCSLKEAGTLQRCGG